MGMEYNPGVRLLERLVKLSNNFQALAEDKAGSAPDAAQINGFASVICERLGILNPFILNTQLTVGQSEELSHVIFGAAIEAARLYRSNREQFSDLQDRELKMAVIDYAALPISTYLASIVRS